MGYDFFTVSHKCTKRDGYIVSADFKVRKVYDLMTRGRSFYAIYNPETGLWSKDEFLLSDVVDQEIAKQVELLRSKTDQEVHGNYLSSFNSLGWKNYRSYVNLMPDNFHVLDSKVIFGNEDTRKEDYASKKLPYSRDRINEPTNYNILMDTLYAPEERRKLEWAVGSIFCGESKNIQKFVVLYGDAGSGKSTFLNIVAQLFEGYASFFEAKQLGQSSAQFSMEQFKDNPIVAIQHDGDLSRIEDNTRLNSIISHETMIMHEKYKSDYEVKLDSFLFMGTNSPVKITNAKSGLIRRLIEVTPTGNKLSPDEYEKVVSAIPFELGAIANHCIEVFEEYGPKYYNTYVPVGMMYKTNRFFNFVEANYSEFNGEYITLTRAFDLYKHYCEDALEDGYRLTKSVFREELKNYFREFYDRTAIDGNQMRSVYVGFKTEMFEYTKMDDKPPEKKPESSLALEFTTSVIDYTLADCPAQYANEDEVPGWKWENVTTKLSDLDTHRLHYVRPPENHIVIDFDLKDKDGNKSAELNLIEAAKWPSTYAEFSKGGNGVHLHYIYDGDVSKLSSVYAPGIEVKVFNGKSSLRRRLSYCNDIQVAHISSGLPFKEEKKVVNFDRIANEQAIRTLIIRNLRKEYHASTKQSVDFIYKILEDAYNGGVVYDVRDMRPKILAFANNSSHQSDYCVKLVSQMKFWSEREGDSEPNSEPNSDEAPIVFYDVEVFPNVLIICWKTAGEGHTVHHFVNPSPQEVERLMRLKLVGFNCRRYDNHIIYAAYLGWSNKEIYELSQKLVSNSANCTFREAYNISFADIYEFSSVKQSLKKFEIELGIHHQENEYPWDEPLAEELWPEVIGYCENDVMATEVTFNARSSDFIAYEILSELTGLPVNSNGNTMTARLIFGNERKPSLVYTDLATGEASDPAYQRTDVINAFPGYEFLYNPVTKKPVNVYRETDVGFGGYVYAEPGMYTDVALIDVESMHPHSAIAMNYFGKFTKRFEELVQARLCIKHGDYEKVKTLFDGKLAKYLDDESKIGDLAYSLKIVINKVYGLTSAKFDNEFRDHRNKNNIVALRGALFMRTLQDEVMLRGFKVAHIKTDSIKIPNATPEIIQFCMEFAKKYGYTFEHEATYERMCLVNDSTYIARYMSASRCQAMYGYVPDKNKKKECTWTPTGAQFQQPFVFKTLFSKEPIEFKDMCETKSVTSAMYLDFNEQLPDVFLFEKELTERSKSGDYFNKKLNKALTEYTDDQLRAEIAKGHNYKFVGKVGLFSPIQSGCGGALLMSGRDGKYASVVGTKGYRWLESEMVKTAGLEDKIDLGYYRHLVDDAIANISKYGDFEWFANIDDPPSESNHPLPEDDVPWLMPCGDPSKTVCEDCPDYATCKLVKGEKYG